MRDVIASHQPKFEHKWFGILQVAAVPYTRISDASIKIQTTAVNMSLAPCYSSVVKLFDGYFQLNTLRTTWPIEYPTCPFSLHRVMHAI